MLIEAEWSYWFPAGSAESFCRAKRGPQSDL
jgi:hypothetical protein